MQIGDILASFDIHGIHDDIMREVEKSRRMGLAVRVATLRVQRPTDRSPYDSTIIGTIRDGDDTSLRRGLNEAIRGLSPDAIKNIERIVSRLKGNLLGSESVGIDANYPILITVQLEGSATQVSAFLLGMKPKAAMLCVSPSVVVRDGRPPKPTLVQLGNIQDGDSSNAVEDFRNVESRLSSEDMDRLKKFVRAMTEITKNARRERGANAEKPLHF